MATRILHIYCFYVFLITFFSIHPWQKVNQVTSSSLARPHHVERQQSYTTFTKTRFFTAVDYFISLSFGTPPQTMDFILDTGSSMTWFPCTQRYNCSGCDFRYTSPSDISTFLPELSSSGKILSCESPKCALSFKADRRPSCKNCDEKHQNCTQSCPPYFIKYGTGTTRGQLLSETLRFPYKSLQDFIVGCSIQSSDLHPYGIVGFGRGPLSLPSQIGLKKFSYCFASNSYDPSKSGELVLVSHNSTGGHANLSYTPFGTSGHHSHYYVTPRKITLGGVNVNVPHKFLVPEASGHGGMTVDSGATFTVMEDEAFEPLAKELEKQMAHYQRVVEVEKLSELRPCYNVTGMKSVNAPELVFHFEGGAKMELQMPNYLMYVIKSEVLCLAIIPFSTVNPELIINLGPSIILGSYQQQEFYLEFDLENQRLGFRKQAC